VSDSISPSDAEKLINRGISLTNNSVKANSKRKINQLSPNSVNINKEKEKERSKKRRIEKKNKLINAETQINQPVYNIEFEGNIRNINALTVIQLRTLLKQKKINTYGSKAELLERLASVTLSFYQKYYSILLNR